MRRATLAALLLPATALLLGACASSSGGAVTATPTSSGSPWIVSYTGSATPSPVPSGSFAPRTPFTTGFLPVSSVHAVPAPNRSAACTGNKFNAGTINGAGVVPGATSATVSWFNPGGSDLVEYRITAISQDLAAGAQRDVGWTVVTPGAACGEISAPVTGLDRRTRYVFSVDAVFRRSGTDGTTAATVARSGVVSTT